MKSKLLPSIVLSSICIVVVLLLAAVNIVTAPKIAEIQAQKVQESLSAVYPDGVNFNELENIESLPDNVLSVHTEDGGGYVFQIEVKGYKSGLIVMCGVDADGKVTGADFVKSSETLSAEVGLGKAYIGQSLDSFEPMLTTGATKTTGAYANAVKTALESFNILTEKEAQ
jgi:Na+-translocating ferredoxin:NAD+ oxidoreductase RnfG subunit